MDRRLDVALLLGLIAVLLVAVVLVALPDEPDRLSKAGPPTVIYCTTIESDAGIATTCERNTP